MKLMSYSTAFEIVSAFGSKHGSASLLDAVSDMEDNMPELTPMQQMALDIVIGEYQGSYQGSEFDV